MLCHVMYMALTSSEGNLARLTGSQYDDAFDPGTGGKVGIWSQITVKQSETRFDNIKIKGQRTS